MQVIAQTRFTSPDVYYDTNVASAPSRGGSNIGNILKRIIKPYIKVQEGKFVLAELGKPYPDESVKYQTLIGIAGAVLIVGAGSLIFGLGRLTKKTNGGRHA